MKIGIFTALFGDKSLTDTLDFVKAEGIEAVELGVREDLEAQSPLPRYGAARRCDRRSRAAPI